MNLRNFRLGSDRLNPFPKDLCSGLLGLEKKIPWPQLGFELANLEFRGEHLTIKPKKWLDITLKYIEYETENRQLVINFIISASRYLLNPTYKQPEAERKGDKDEVEKREDERFGIWSTVTQGDYFEGSVLGCCLKNYIVQSHTQDITTLGPSASIHKLVTHSVSNINLTL